MINIILFVFCLISSYSVDGNQDTLQEDFIQLGSLVTSNFAGAILQPAQSGTSFYGVSGIVTLYNPRVVMGQMSVAGIWVENGFPNNLNAIIVGWHVYPQVYNDDKTHLFASWVSNNLNRGCLNLQCEGFVKADGSLITLGQSFNQTSTIDGLTVELSLAILQDPNEKRWLIYVNEKEIGYYPMSLFSNLTDATQLAWFGKTTSALDTPSPPMGYGVLPNGVLGHACYFKDLKFVNNLRQLQKLSKDMGEVQTTKPGCYDAAYYDDTRIGLSLQFGGPGGGMCSVL